MMKSGIISFLSKTTTISLFLFLLGAHPSSASAWSLLPWTSEAVTTPQEVLPATVVNPAEEFQYIIKDMASQLFQNLEDQDPEMSLLAEGVAFTVFVDLKKLSRTSSFGRYLAEQLMTEFQQQGYSVLELRKSSSILIQEKRGEYGLSRDSGEIGSALQARTLLTGTYTLADDHIMVNAKILDNKNALMLSSANVIFSKNSLTESLLSDATSAHPKVKANVYMKKLEI
jgi:TolB-like protein